MTSRLGDVRKARGISAIDLAAQCGVTRQAIYAIEAGTYMPNTAVALRLARILETTVEDLFILDPAEAPPSQPQAFELLDSESPLLPGEPLQVCRIGKRVIGVSPSAFPAWLPMADGIVAAEGFAALAGDHDTQNRLLIAGCDPALSLLAAHGREAGVDVVLANSNSARALEWLKAGKIDVAGSHLNEPVAAARPWNAVTFAVWQEGFVVRRGNPKSIRNIEDLANPKVRFANREMGSGSRRLFETLLNGAGLTSAKVRTTEHTSPGHLAAAWTVASGEADCCIAAASAARRFGLDFVPLASERFELILHKRDLGRKPIQALLEVLNRSRFRRQLETVAGYDVSHAGELIA